MVPKTGILKVKWQSPQCTILAKVPAHYPLVITFFVHAECILAATNKLEPDNDIKTFKGKRSSNTYWELNKSVTGANISIHNVLKLTKYNTDTGQST